MEVKDLAKWVNEYNLVFKVTYGPKTGCMVNIHKLGYDRPMWAAKGNNLIEALDRADNLLKRIFEMKLEDQDYGNNKH